MKSLIELGSSKYLDIHASSSDDGEDLRWGQFRCFASYS